MTESRKAALRRGLLATGVAVSVLAGALPAHAADTVNFRPQVDYPTGQLPWEIAAADVNADGAADLLSVNREGDSISVLLGNGDGTFQPKVDYPTGNQPFFVEAADLSGDGALDLVVPRADENAVTVLLGAGDGTFGSPADYASGIAPQFVSVDDLNGDGALDVVSANWEGDTVSVLLGAGDGTLGAKTDYPTGNGPAGVALADVNGDGALDALTANFVGDTVSVLLGNGDGTLQPFTDFPAGDTADSLALADLDGDGDLDAITGNHFEDSVSVMPGAGDGTFGAKIDYPTGYRSNDVDVADMNRDGALDVVTSNWEGGTVSVLLGNGDGTLGTNVNFQIGPLSPSVVVSDFNLDGWPDLAVTNYELNSAAVLVNAGEEASDTTPPVTTATTSPGDPSGQNGWFTTSPVTVTLAATDDASSVATTRYSLDGGTWTAYSAPIEVSGEGRHTLEYASVDTVGNAEAPKTLSVDIDTGPPTSSAVFADPNDDGWHNGTVPVTLTASDEGSGVDTIEYSLDGGAWATYTDTVEVSGEGEHVLEFRATDNAGQVEDVKSAVLKIDSEKPTLLVSGIADGQIYGDSQDVRITWQALDSTSGIKNVAGSLDGASIESGRLQALYELTLGVHRLTVTADDHAGNTVTTEVLFGTTASYRDVDNLIDRFDAVGWLSSRAASRLHKQLQKAWVAEAEGNDPRAVRELRRFQELVEDQGLVDNVEVRDVLLRDTDVLLGRLRR